MQLLIILPILIPFATAMLCVFTRRSVAWQRWLGVVGSILLVAVNVLLLVKVDEVGIAVTQMGAWPAPFGITLVADRFTAIMLVTTSFVAAAGVVYATGSLDAQRQSGGVFLLFNLLMMGVSGLLLAGDIFNLYVWVELTLASSFVLMALGGDRLQLEGTLKYMAVNVLASFLLLASVGLLYGLAGTLNMADLAQRLSATPPTATRTAIAVLMLAALGIKAAIFPLFFWLPASYHTPPIAISAIFAGIMTKVGVYAIVRVFTLLFVHQSGVTHTMILVLGGATMITGVLGAVAQHDIRRLLSFHIISQIGYMLMGLGLLTVGSLAATIFFIVHIVITKTALFFVAGLAGRAQGSYELDHLHALYRQRPVLAACFLIPALSLGGMPPLSGFIGKLAIVQAGLNGASYVMVVVALVVSVLTLYSMTKIWDQAFWFEDASTHHGTVGPALPAAMVGPAAVLAVATVVLGLAAGPCMALATRAAEQLMDPQVYIRTVLNGGD